MNPSTLKQIVTEARPLIEQMLDLSEKMTALRELVTANGGDWSQLKALIKAQVQDERDEAGDGKHVRKILDRADYATAYADMLGLAKMNEFNSFPSSHRVGDASAPLVQDAAVTPSAGMGGEADRQPIHHEAA